MSDVHDQGDQRVPLKKLLAFVSANQRLSYARRQLDRAQTAHEVAQHEFEAAWDALTPEEQRALNHTFEAGLEETH